MRKKIIITLIVLAIIASATTAGYYLLRGRLAIQASPAPVNITVDKKTHEDSTNLELNLLIGPHKVVVKKDYYNDAILNPWISLNKTTAAKVTLTKSPDGLTLTENASKITGAWIEYTGGKNKETFLAVMKKYLDSGSYGSQAEAISQADITNESGITMRTQTVTGPVKSIKLTKIDDDSAKAEVTVTKTAGELSISSLEIYFIKSGGEWVSNNIIYNY